ncbi:MAG TPA: nuclear transport factor 2 family protein [Chitinophagaceae bacterium]|nr:nuclear transport factor 2 family protein [Chitinophagaceae bacterium]MCB9056439.1 nuclear transport factor 2 family protein [Chitinophagales bacterium]HPG11630.1 nuclear transport factor 2 family protein [Chitinophagaceae bacterium]HRX94978.1 nuclear transport factor 2 family protein [Chitinophagaceae bacterium]
MRYFLIVLTMLGLSMTTKAQSAEDSVKATINKMFDAMRKADGEMLKSCFSDSIVFQTIARSKEGKMIVRNESADGFVSQISKATAGLLDERITYETIKVDGPLALAWTPYSFYYNGNFSHCGVNSFQLVRFDGEWKIQYIIDTRRRQGCMVEQ